MAEVAKVEKKVQDLFKPEIKELNPWLSPTFSKVDSLGGEPGFKVDDIPERLGLLQKGEGFSSETYYFSDLEGTPDDYGIKNQFLQTDGKSKLRWAWPFWSKAGSTVYYKSGKVAIGHAAAKTIFHIAKGEETIASRISCKVSPWRQWECLDSDYGFALGIAADDKKFHFHYDTPMGTVSVHLMCLDALNSRVGIFQDSPSYPFDVGGNTRIQGTLGSGKLTVDSGVGQSIIIKGTSTGDANLGWIGFYDSDGTTRRGHIGDGSSNDDDIYIGADTGYLRLLAAGYISLGTHTYFPDDVVMSFGASLDYSVGYAQATDTLQIVDGTTLGSNVRLKLDSSGHFDFGAGNLSTTGTLGAGQTTLAKSTLADDGRGLSSIFTLSADPAKSDGIALYTEGHIGDITTDGPTYGGGIWLNIDSGATLAADVRALDIGIYERGADCTGGNAYGLAIHLDFDSTNSPAAIYPFRLNCEVSGATPDALIFAANKSALAVTEGDFPYNNYLKIVVQDGTVYRIPLITEGVAEFIALHSKAELRFYDNGNYVGFEAPALTANKIWVLPIADASNAAKALGSNASGTLAWYGHDDLYGFAANEHYLQTAITVVGTIGTGVWQGSSIAVTYTDAKCTDANADQTSVNETSHTTVVVDADFASNGILKRTSAGVYGIVTDASANWNIAFGWGDHASGGYAAASHNMASHSDETTYNISTSGTLSIGSGVSFINESANTKMTTGLTIHQGAAYNEILAFKQTGVAHGITDWAETDTYGIVKIQENVVGGVSMWGFTEDITAFGFRGVSTNDDVNKDATALAPFMVFVYKKSGTTLGSIGANGNLFAIKHGGDGTTKFIVDVEGDVLYDGGASSYQEHDDIALLGELEDILSNRVSKLEMKKKDVFKKHKIVHVSEGVDKEDKPFFSRFVSTKKKNMLLYGAIRQLNERVEALEAGL